VVPELVITEACSIQGANKNGKASDGRSYIECAESDEIKGLLQYIAMNHYVLMHALLIVNIASNILFSCCCTCVHLTLIYFELSTSCQ